MDAPTKTIFSFRACTLPQNSLRRPRRTPGSSCPRTCRPCSRDGRSRRGGRIIIEYYSEEELGQLYDRLTGWYDFTPASVNPLRGSGERGRERDGQPGAVPQEAAERAKIELSEKDKVPIQVPALITDAKGRSHNLDIVLSRSQFNQMVMDLVQRTFKVCDEALQSGRLTPAEVDGVILVGGPTRLPIIRNSVRHYFQREPLTDVDPDEVA